MQYLEDYRHNQLGSSYLILNSKPEHKVFLTYDLHVTKAFYNTFNDLVELENSKNFMLGSGAQTHTAISFWFLALESFINTLVKVACLKKNIDFREYKGENLTSRVSILLDLLELDKIKFYKTGIIAKLNELCSFRNELFHDGNFSNKIKFSKTNFSEIPFLSNQADTFQTILILLEIVQSLRFSILGIDTTPYTILTNGIIGSWDTLETSYKEILKPCFEQALGKHNVSIKFNLDIPHVEQFKSDIVKKGEVSAHITVEQEEQYFIKVNETDSRMCVSIFQDFLRSKNMNEKDIRIGNRYT